ncbi:MAG: efflux RND transporter periplasmic adaptor subunit [Planctomycetales bacterium]|nr:efflux RND transporter periplasmic adaptor subunit [Planctomycetales bacterium]
MPHYTAPFTLVIAAILAAAVGSSEWGDVSAVANGASTESDSVSPRPGRVPNASTAAGPRERESGREGRLNEVSRKVREVPGLVRAYRELDLYAAVPGLVERLGVKEGDQVEQGALIASLEDAVTRASVEVARLQAEQSGSVRFAESELAYAESLLRRMESALAADARGVSQQEIEAARANHAKSVANLKIARESQAQAEARYELELARLENLRVRAPFAGTITKVEIEEGDKAFENLVLATLIDSSKLSVVLYVPWEHRDLLTVGSEFPLTADAPVNRPVSATLVHIDPVLDPALQAVRTRWEIPNDKGELPVGFLVRFEP